MKNWKRTAKNGITNPKKDKKEWKGPFQEREKKKKNLERERSFLNGNVFLSVLVPANFHQRTSLCGINKSDAGAVSPATSEDRR